MTTRTPPDDAQLVAVLGELRQRTLTAIVGAARRRHRAHVLAGVIVATTLVAGTAASTVVIATHPWAVTPSIRTLYQLYCVEGHDVNGQPDDGTLTDPYYSAEFYVSGTAGQKLEIDAVGACQSIWRRAVATNGLKGLGSELFPSHLFHSQQVTDVSWSGEWDGPSTFAGYGTRVPPMAECVRPDEKGAAVYVISANPGEKRVTTRQWQVRCEINEGFVYRK